MAINELDRSRLEKKFKSEEFKRVYIEFIEYCKGGLKAGIDISEYGSFVQMTLKKDIDSLCAAYMNNVLNFGEFWNVMQQIVAFDLIIQSTIEDAIHVKSNGEDKDEE